MENSKSTVLPDQAWTIVWQVLCGAFLVVAAYLDVEMNQASLVSWVLLSIIAFFYGCVCVCVWLAKKPQWRNYTVHALFFVIGMLVVAAARGLILGDRVTAIVYGVCAAVVSCVLFHHLRWIASLEKAMRNKTVIFTDLPDGMRRDIADDLRKISTSLSGKADGE